MRIGDVDLRATVLVVAEIGNNHEGNFSVAAELVRQAAASGAGAVKVQTFRPRYLVSAAETDRFERLSRFALSHAQFADLAGLATSLGLLFLATPLDLESAAFLEDHVHAYKIASGDNNFYPLMERLAATGKPVILSSGLADLAQIRQSARFLTDQWARRGIGPGLAVLHCVSSYPAPDAEANLAAIPLLSRELGCLIGYSDHTLGTEACVAAVALGARIIEKHFTLDTHYSDFRDHQLSADPVEMKRLVDQVRRVSAMLGKAEKAVQPSEAAGAYFSRRSIVASADLKRDHRLERQDFTWIRPGGGLPPGDEHRLLGKTLNRDVMFGEAILPRDVE